MDKEKSQVKAPLYQGVEEELKRQIITGELAPGTKMSSELSLAAEFKVSRTTIRHALISLESHGFVERIHGRGTFVAAKTVTKNHRKTKSGGIYAIVPYLTSRFTGTIVTGVQEVLFSEGYDLSILPTNDCIEREIDYLEMIIQRDAAGVVLHPTKSKYYNPLVHDLIKNDIPLVMTGRYYRYVDCSYVDGDNYQGAYDATSHLINLGHSKIGLVSKELLIHTSLHDRIEGYRDVMADNGLAIDRRMVLLDLDDQRNVYWAGNNEINEHKIINTLVDYLRRTPQMTAVLALNDQIAADLMKAAEIVGRTVGEDLSIIGFDNVILSTSLKPALTTVGTSILEMGKRAANILLDDIKGESSGFVKESLPMQLVIRESCTYNKINTLTKSSED